MAVIHYMKNNEILCGTKAKNFKSTDNKDSVTCKRCLNKFKATNSIRVSKTKGDVILTVKRVEMKFPLNGSIDNFRLSAPEGMVFTSCGLHGTQVKRVMGDKDRKDIASILKSLKVTNKGLYANDIFNHFSI